ncbi:MAG: EpsG family protein [Paludibacteraceae bacterium]|nr:EpsG family protein [Paludibacteraceae bacterium]
MWIYIVLYMLLFLTSMCELSEEKKKYNLFFLYFWVVVFTLFRGLRWGTGTDWSQYYACFEKSDWSNIFSYYRYGLYTELMESGYVFLNVLIKSLFKHYTSFLLLTNLAVLLNYAHFCRTYVPKYPLMTFVLVLFFTPIFPVRQDIAIIFLLWACYFSINKKIILSLFFVFIASTIHDMSVIFFPVCLLFNLQISITTIFVLGIVFVLFVNDAFLFSILQFLGGLSLGSVSEMSSMYFENVNNEPVKVSLFRKVYTIIFLVMFKYYYEKKIDFPKLLKEKRENASLEFKYWVRYIRRSMMYRRVLNFYTNGYLCLFMILLIAAVGGPLSGCARLMNFFWVSFPFCYMIVYSMERNITIQRRLLVIYVVYSLYYFFKFDIFEIDALYRQIYFPYYSVFEEVPYQRIVPW